jgi:hypothetical protein
VSTFYNIDNMSFWQLIFSTIYQFDNMLLLQLGVLQYVVLPTTWHSTTWFSTSNRSTQFAAKLGGGSFQIVSSCELLQL